MGADTKYRILLIDDEDDILEFMRYNLVKAGYAVFTARDGAEGFAAAIAHRPHLILLDRLMPRMDGLETCRRLREEPLLRRTVVVFMSALGKEEEQLEGFAAGADDYIPKPFKLSLLMSRVAAILKRIEPDAGSALRIDADSHSVWLHGERIELPRKEFSLLALLCSEPGKLFSREEILEKVWGREVVVGDRTIDVHIRKLRQKLGDHFIATVKGLGYRFTP